MDEPLKCAWCGKVMTDDDLDKANGWYGPEGWLTFCDDFPMALDSCAAKAENNPEFWDTQVWENRQATMR